MSWITNLYDPHRADAKSLYCCQVKVIVSGNDAMEKEWERYLENINKYTIGTPKASEVFSVEELQEMHMVGIYSND